MTHRRITAKLVLTGFVILIMVNSFNMAYGSSSVGSGKSCQKLNQAKKIASGSFICLRNGKKLEWSVKVAKLAQIPTSATRVCDPKELPSLPLASERMAITKMKWAKDKNGYVSVSLTIRNDNPMNLRVVQYQFYYWYGLERRSTAFTYPTTNGTTTVEHVFSKDTENLMGIEKLPGSWLPDQSRTFLIDTGKILDCTKISALDSDYNVLQGVGG